MFWTERGDSASRPVGTTAIELAETAGPEEARGRSEAMAAYANAAERIATEARDIAGPWGPPGPMSEWLEWISATERAGGEISTVKAARLQWAQTAETLGSEPPRQTEEADRAWAFYAPIAALAGTTAAADHHLNVIENTAADVDARRAHGLALEMAIANLAYHRESIPDSVPKSAPGSTNRNRRLLNATRRQADEVRDRFDNGAGLRLGAIGIEKSRRVDGRRDHAETADATAREMLRRNHAFAIAGLAQPEGGTVVIYWHDTLIRAKRAEESYEAGFDAGWASLHGQAMLTLATGRTEEGGDMDAEERSGIAGLGLVTMLRAGAGLHSISGERLEAVVRIIEMAEDYRNERSEVLRRMAGGQHALYGWLADAVGERRSNVTENQARAMMEAGRNAQVPPAILRQLASRMGQPEAAAAGNDSGTWAPLTPAMGWGDVKQALKAVRDLGGNHLVARTVARALGIPEDDARLQEETSHE